MGAGLRRPTGCVSYVNSLAYSISFTASRSLLMVVRSTSTSQALALRCRIVLESATGASNKDVAARLGVEAHTVSRWRARFVRDRLEGLADEPRPGGPRKITDHQVEDVVVRTLEATP